jgi:peroxiredoxin
LGEDCDNVGEPIIDVRKPVEGGWLPTQNPFDGGVDCSAQQLISIFEVVIELAPPHPCGALDMLKGDGCDAPFADERPCGDQDARPGLLPARCQLPRHITEFTELTRWSTFPVLSSTFEGPMTSTELPTIAAQAQQVKAASAARLPQEVRDAFAADLAAVTARGVSAGVAAPGTLLPDADLTDPYGNPTTLAAVRAGRAAVVVLYRGAWCPYCNLTLREYQASLLPALEKRGVALIAISPQRPDGSLNDVERRELTYAVLSDEGNQIAGALGVLITPSEQSLTAQRQLGLDLTQANADGTAQLPMPTVVVSDPDGIIQWIDVHPDYTTRSEVSDILNAIAAL